MFRICKQCGKEFTTKDTRVRYCSKECRVKSSNNNRGSSAVHEERICPECGKKFISRRSNSIYCSRECILKVSGRKRRKIAKEEK